LHWWTIIGTKTSEHDFSREAGKASIGDDLSGEQDISLRISSSLTGLKASKRLPQWLHPTPAVGD
jgi:hypothetical protein